MPEQFFTAGQIKRQGKLLTIFNTPIKSHDLINRIVNKYATHYRQTPNGMSKVLSQTEIDKFNQERLALDYFPPRSSDHLDPDEVTPMIGLSNL